jgi:hypothetical protein
VDDDIGVGEIADLPQLGRGEPDVLRPVPDQDVDVAHRAVAQGSSTRSGTSVAAMSSAVRPSTLASPARRCRSRPPRHLDGRATGRLHAAGMPAVPADELAGALRARQFLAGDAEPRGSRRRRWRGRPCDSARQHVEGHAAGADPDTTEELDERRVERLLQHRITDFIFA